VTDSSGGAIPNAQVTIRDVVKGVVYTTTSNETGSLQPDSPDCRHWPGSSRGEWIRPVRSTERQR